MRLHCPVIVEMQCIFQNICNKGVGKLTTTTTNQRAAAPPVCIRPPLTVITRRWKPPHPNLKQPPSHLLSIHQPQKYRSQLITAEGDGPQTRDNKLFWDKKYMEIPPVLDHFTVYTNSSTGCFCFFCAQKYFIWCIGDNDGTENATTTVL